MLCYKDVANVWGPDAYEADKLDTRNAVNVSLGYVNGTQFGDNYYWSSSEYADYGDYAFNVYFNNANVYYYIKTSTGGYVRAVCAY